MKSPSLALCLIFGVCAHAYAGDIVIRGVTVVDVTDGSLQPERAVHVRGDRIAAVGAADTFSVPDEADLLEAESGYLIPGLWDAHVHSAGSVSWHFPLYLAHGITSVRNMHTTAEKPLELIHSIKRRLASGELLGPRFLANGGVLDGDPPIWPGTVVVRNAEEARSAVDSLVDGGADFIKVYDRLIPETYFAVLERAKQRGIPVDGHMPFLIPPEQAAAAGQRTFEHTSGIVMGCSSEGDALRNEYRRHLEEVPSMPPYPDAMVAFFTLVRQAIDTRDPELCVQAARVFREHGVASVPTLVNGSSDSRAFVNDSSRMNLLPPSVRDQWRTMADAGDPFEDLIGSVSGTGAKNVRVLHDEGVVILAGTDVGNPFLVPGLSLHRELGMLVEAGLTPLEALRAATLSPARVLGMADSLGTVEAGKLADLVLLDADPLDDIANTRRIRAVVVDGRMYRRADLDRLLAEAKAWNPASGNRE